jgi:hypothetical protein
MTHLEHGAKDVEKENKLKKWLSMAMENRNNFYISIFNKKEYYIWKSPNKAAADIFLAETK